MLLCLLSFIVHRVGLGYPLSAFSPSLSIYCLIFCFFIFTFFLVHFTYFLLLFIPSLSTRIVSLRCLAGSRRRRPNLGVVCSVYFIHRLLAVTLETSYLILYSADLTKHSG